MSFSEADVIEVLTEVFSSTDPRLLIGIGDDAALVKANGQQILTTDIAVEGVHFRSDWSTAFEIGQRIAIANIADVLAMNGKCDYLLVAATLTGSETLQWIKELAQGIRFEADRAQLKQVLINLVRNAVEAGGPGSTVVLRARTGQARLRGIPMAVVVLEVVDRGAGIPAEARERLFDPFFTTKEDGTGLGLSIAARIVEKHGGALEYQTDPDRGSTFGVVLPRPVQPS